MNTSNDETKAKFKLPPGALITYLLIASLIATGFTLSRYAASGISGDSSRVALFNVETTELTLTSEDNVLDSLKVDEVQYTFNINNASEVAVRCAVNITGYDSSLTCTVAPEPVELAPNGSQMMTVTFTLTDPETAQTSVVDNINVSVTAEQIQ